MVIINAGGVVVDAGHGIVIVVDGGVGHVVNDDDAGSGCIVDGGGGVVIMSTMTVVGWPRC